MGKRDIATNTNARNMSIFRSINKIISIVLSIVICLLLIVSVVLTYNMIIQKEQKNHIAGFSFLTVIEDNVDPSLKTGDIVVIKRVSTKDLQVGDVISYEKDSTVITNRIKKISVDGVITEGNSNKLEGGFIVDSGNILGKHIVNIPNGDYILSLSRNPFFTFGIFLLLLVNISFLSKAFWK